MHCLLSTDCTGGYTTLTDSTATSFIKLKRWFGCSCYNCLSFICSNNMTYVYLCLFIKPQDAEAACFRPVSVSPQHWVTRSTWPRPSQCLKLVTARARIRARSWRTSRTRPSPPPSWAGPRGWVRCWSRRTRMTTLPSTSTLQPRHPVLTTSSISINLMGIITGHV